MPEPLALFEGFGIELEYMIVDAETLDVRPLADELLRDELGGIENEIERGAFARSNELARHVVEVKTNGPAPSLDGLAEGFAAEVRDMNDRLQAQGARLLPTGMHPWMKPSRDFELWPHGDHSIYQAFDRIFDCRGHGWANLQSAHLNLPFSNDEEFGRLHAAIRALLPILPALAASSPFVEGRRTKTVDSRLVVYGSNASRVPSVAGAVIPEPVFTRSGYEALLEGIYADLAPHDPEGLLRYEWVNARGCIARFDRMAIEIRLLDVQECPRADLAIAAAVTGALRFLCAQGPDAGARLRGLATEALAGWLQRTSASGGEVRIDDPAYLEALGLAGRARSASEVWSELLARAPEDAWVAHRPTLEVLLTEGCLSRRILRRTGQDPTARQLADVYREIADCLSEGRLLRAAA